MKYSSARFFQRREDYQPPQTQTDSPFRRFIVKCLACRSCRLTVKTQFEEARAELTLVLTCSRCGQSERLPVK
jgi:RNase P subunit RPR2